MPAEAGPNLTGLSLEPPCAAQSGDPPRIGTSAEVPLASVAGKHRKNMAALWNFILTCLRRVTELKHGVLEACAVSQDFRLVSLQRGTGPLHKHEPRPNIAIPSLAMVCSRVSGCPGSLHLWTF